MKVQSSVEDLLSATSYTRLCETVIARSPVSYGKQVKPGAVGPAGREKRPVFIATSFEGDYQNRQAGQADG